MKNTKAVIQNKTIYKKLKKRKTVCTSQIKSQKKRYIKKIDKLWIALHVYANILNYSNTEKRDQKKFCTLSSC